MKLKEKGKKRVIVPTRLHPSQINELSMCCFLIKKERLDDMLSFIVNNGGRVVSAVPSCGISRNLIANTVGGFQYDWYFVLSMCQQEISDIFISAIAKEFELYKSGNGFCFMIDILGYLGAKGPFVE